MEKVFKQTCLCLKIDKCTFYFWRKKNKTVLIHFSTQSFTRTHRMCQETTNEWIFQRRENALSWEINRYFCFSRFFHACILEFFRGEVVRLSFVHSLSFYLSFDTLSIWNSLNSYSTHDFSYKIRWMKRNSRFKIYSAKSTESFKCELPSFIYWANTLSDTLSVWNFRFELYTHFEMFLNSK